MKSLKIFLIQFNKYVKFGSHPNLALFKNKFTNGNNFKFELVSLSDTEFDSPPKILKLSSEARVNVLHRPFNETITKGVFPDILKLADVTAVFRKDNSFDKKSRLVSILPTISKIYEKLIQ